LDQQTISALRWGTYLHDIGKIAISDAILRKPGRLDDQELRVMRQHAAIGHSFAIQLGFLPPESLEVILYHHERWDGQGYPDGRVKKFLWWPAYLPFATSMTR
jgi:HD-GYP domain-containing protein (c-di-GMP phosphodiesterase class II)